MASHDHEHEHRMAHDGGGWKAALVYGRNAKKFWRSDVNEAVVGLAGLKPGQTGLDIGAGVGAAVFSASGRVGSGGRVIAVEPTPFMRRSLSMRRRMTRGGRQVEVVDGVAEHLPVETDSVDAAWAVNVLHHISDLAAAVEELARVVRPGGRVVLVDEDFDDPTHPAHEEMKERHGSGHNHSGGDHHHETDDHGHHHLMVDGDVLAKTMSAAGFVAVDTAVDHIAGVPALVLTASAPAR